MLVTLLNAADFLFLRIFQKLSDRARKPQVYYETGPFHLKIVDEVPD